MLKRFLIILFLTLNSFVFSQQTCLMFTEVSLRTFTNTYLPDAQVKIYGLMFGKADDRYSLTYIDPDLCYTSGNIRINFNNPTKTQLQWNYFQNKYEWLDSDCFFYNYPPDQLPNPLPKTAIFIKQ